MNLDITIFNWFNSLAERSSLGNKLIVFFAQYLPYLVVVVFIVLLYFSIYPRREKIYIFLVGIFAAIVSRFGITVLIRYLYYRPRPFITYQVHQLIPESNGSFPSGHASFLFALAATIYLYNKKWGIWVFIISLFICIARIMAGVHYPSDILAGIIVGVTVGSIVAKLAENPKIKGLTR